MRAHLKLVVRFPHFGGKAVQNLFFCNLHERRVTLDASGEGLEHIEEIEPMEDFDELKPGIGCTHEVASEKALVLQKLAILAEERSVLFGCELYEVRIVGVGVVGCVETDHAQVVGKLTEMNVQHKPRAAERTATEARQR